MSREANYPRTSSAPAHPVVDQSTEDGSLTGRLSTRPTVRPGVGWTASGPQTPRWGSVVRPGPRWLGVAQDHAGGCSRPAPRLGAPTVVARPDRGGSPGLFRRMVLTGLVAHLADRAGQGDGPPVTAEGRGTRRPVRCVHWGCEARRVGPASGRGVVPSPRRGGPRPWPGSWAGPVRVPTGQARTEAAPRGRHRSGRI